MSPRDTFTLRLPDSKPIDVVLIELEDGTIVARTAPEAQAAAEAAESAARG